MAKKDQAEQPEKLQEMKMGEIEVDQQEREDIFLIVRNDKKFLIAITNQIVSRNVFDTVEEARAYIQSKPWELILNATAVMMKRLEELKQVNNQ